MTVQEEYFQKLSLLLKEKFTKKGFAFDSFNNKEEAKKFVLSLIKADDTITFGGSTSVNQMGILEDLKNYKNFIDRNNKDLKTEAEIKAFTSDIYLCSANAISKNGDIVSTDGFGNRVAAMTYGPKKVFLIVGKNKVCNTEKEALKRVRDVAAAQNSVRFKVDNPCCIVDMICDEEKCDIEKRICSATVIINKCSIKDRIHIIFINEELGF
ncbi:lactate utilization protein [Brachyspira sp.]|uniref:lactate utilization protein n=1 Tax=Brachyspira sp. TaxID=1977261 RepID=UPI002614F5C6|nr:lactate utilization protein [Brachyspira sp.]